MDARRFRTAWDVVSAALDVDRAARAAWVEQRCGADAELLAEVRSLLAHAEVDVIGATPMAIECNAVPGRIAEYTIVRRIGAGGMGVVYEAIQDQPNRRVALKVMRAGTVPGLARRFEYEVEALASLQHPGITQVFGSGTYRDGDGVAPFFAMEYVEGQPLDEYVDERRIGRRERLELFVAICDAVAHAHHKGVLHRDLKPDNILVTAAGEPKVLDFGVARAIDGDGANGTRLTDAGRIVGTLAYMSPEQVQGRRDEVTVGSDVWSLGVIAYELLTGQLPFEVHGRDVATAARTIVETEPVPLGRRDRRLGGDLAVVLATAIDKDPSRRYHSVPELAAEVRRVLADRPIVARPASAWVRLRKFVRRNPLPAGLGAALFITVVVAFVATLRQNRALDETVGDLRRLADGRLIEQLQNEFAHLPAARVSDADTLRVWLAKGRAAVARRPLHARALAAVRRRALVNVAADIERHRRRHPTWDERRELGHRLAHRRSELGATPTAAQRQEIAALERRLAEIDAEVGQPWRFADPADEWEHESLTRVLALCDEFSDPESGSLHTVARWLEIVPRLARITIDEHAELWSQVVADIANLETSPWYGGLAIAPQIGLVPLGRDPRTGYHEFGHPQTGRIAERDDDGELVLTDDVGLVFVLLPGGRFRMGARLPDAGHPPGSANVDPGSVSIERPVHEVELDPFLLSKFEMTKAQWRFFTGRRAGQLRGTHDDFNDFGPRDPVETVHWVGCDEVTRALGLTLPTEAQWEYAARAGSSTIHPWGDDPASLAGAVNCYDRVYMQHEPSTAASNPVAWALDDGVVHVAPVGSYRPNAFGLHDMLGNVGEWCLDTPVGYSVPHAAGDGRHSGGHPGFRQLRGGAYLTRPQDLRVAKRDRRSKWTNIADLGLRPARTLR